MKTAEAAPLIRRWLAEYGRSVEITLARSGVSTASDRADFKQEVFITAFLALIHEGQIDHPRAWLNECARKMASNYRRKAERRALPAGGKEIATLMTSPEQTAEDREALRIVFDCLDEESREIVFAVRGDGLTWAEIASERGITVDHARYVYTMAVTEMEAALARADSRTNKRRSVAFPLLLAQVFEAVRAEVDETSPELDRQVREGLERFMAAAGAGAPDPDHEPKSSVRPSATSIPTPSPSAPSVAVGTVLGILGGSLLLWLLLGPGFHRALLAKPPLETSRDRSTPALTVGAPVDRAPDVQAPAPLVLVAGSATAPEKPAAQSAQVAGGISAAHPSNIASARGSLILLDRARAAFRARNAPGALTLVAQHARSFPGKLFAEDRRERLKLICTAPSVRDAIECASLSPVTRPN